jgi:hypothetical protein
MRSILPRWFGRHGVLEEGTPLQVALPGLGTVGWFFPGSGKCHGVSGKAGSTYRRFGVCVRCTAPLRIAPALLCLFQPLPCLFRLGLGVWGGEHGRLGERS